MDKAYLHPTVEPCFLSRPMHLLVKSAIIKDAIKYAAVEDEFRMTDDVANIYLSLICVHKIITKASFLFT